MQGIFSKNAINPKDIYFSFSTESVSIERKSIQPPPDVLQRLANIFDVSIDYLMNGNKSDIVEQILKDAELIKQFKQLDKLPEDEKKSILKVLNALIRDFNAKQASVL